MKKLLLALLLVPFAFACFAQAPVISYQSPQNYIVGTTINNLAPVKTGGAVPSTIYGQVTTIAGTGAKGSANGTGSSATFNEPYGLAADSKGNIYVADYSNNIIRKITPGGLVSTFVPASAGLRSPAGVAMDGADNLYIADGGNNQVKKVTPAGVVSVIAGTGDYGFSIGPALSSSFKSPSGIAVDGAGNVYVSDFGNQQIRKIAGGVVTVLAGTGAGGFVNGDNTVARFNGPFGIATDAAGNVYVADINNNAIRMVTPTGVVSTLAGNGTAGAVNGTGAAARFERPYSVAVDATGNVYVGDSNNSLVRKITPGGVVTTLAGSAGNFGTVNAVGTDALFSFPVGIVVDGKGNLYTADNASNTIRKVILTGYKLSPALPAGLSFDASTGIISGKPTGVSPAQDYTVTAYNTSGSGSAIVNITTRLIATDATLSSLVTSGVTLSPAFSPSQLNYVMTVPETTTSINITPSLADINATLKINGSPVVSGSPFVLPVNTGGNTATIQAVAEDGVTTITYTVSVTRPRKAVAPPVITYSTPQQYTVNVAIPPLLPKNTGGAVPANAYGGVTTVKSGLADASAVAVDPAGNVFVSNVVDGIIQKISPGGTVSTFATGFSSPYGLGADVFGNIYVGDSGHNMIKKISATGQVTIVSGKSGDYDFANGDAENAAKYKYPIGVAADASGNLYVGDLANYDIRKISIAGQVTTLAGTNSVGSANNSTGSAASFNEPYGVATDLSGNVYVADSKNNLIRKITPSGATTTLAGSGAAGQNNATGTAASFEAPKGVATDVLGNVYVVDAANSLIRKITPAGVTTRLAGSGYYNFTDGIGPLAAFSYPIGIAADADGQLYIADGNKAIRKIQTTGFVISPNTLPAGLTFDATTGKISGTPTVAAAPANFTITAYNLGGSSAAVVNIRVNGLNNDATLKSLDLSSGTLTPLFDSGTLTYVTSNTGNASFITLTPTSTQGSATIKINGTTVVSGTASANLPLVVGPNVFNIVVTATDGMATKSYQLTVNRPVPVYATDATLSSLTTTNATFSPSFNNNTVTYTATVASTVTGLTLTPSSSESHAAIVVNGTALASGTESGNIPLNYGSNTITTKVTAEDGVTVKTYTLTVIRQASANADLTGIILSAGHLTPNFSANGLTYSAEVPTTLNTISLTAYTADATATLKVNGTTVASGAASGAIPLVVGSNVITVSVTAQDNATVKNYQVTVLRDPSSNATLSALTPSSGTLSPAFAPTNTTYTSSVPNTITSITLMPVSGAVNEIITINGITVASGTASTAIPLSVGNNPIAIQVTAEDGITVKNYLLTVSRLPSADAGLAGLATDPGDLVPLFATGNATYSTTVSNASAAIKITPAVNEPNATVTVNGVSVASGTASGAIALNVGPNIITVKVIAQDGVAAKTYTITATRAGSPNADLANLEINPGSLNEVFDPGVTAYSATVSNTTTLIKVTPALSEANATVSINGVAVASGAASGNIALNAGPNVINVVVSAQDGTTIKKYTITVTREPSSNADLINITLNTGSLNEVFATGTYDYTANVLNTDANIQVKTTVVDATTTITVNGTAVAGGVFSGNIPLNVGPNSITIVVTAQDGITIKTYTVTVNRPPSANADLADIGLNAGTIKPPFSTGMADYNASVDNMVDNITLTPMVSDVTAKVTVNGVAVVTGTPSAAIALNVGSNKITIVVTAENGTTTKTYTVTVLRALSSDASLANLDISPAKLSQTFSAGVLTYSSTVSNATTAVKVTPALNEPNATVTVNGVSVASGAASSSIALNVGPNIITTTVTAQDGVAVKTYTVTVNRAGSSNADLAGLGITPGSLNEAFDPGVMAYSASVSNTTASIKVIPALSEANASVTINGVAVSSGVASGGIALNLGSNVITVSVTAQDGVTIKNYSVTVTREPSTNADLTNIALSTGSLNEVFATNTLNYSANVLTTDANIRLKATVSDATATITVNGATVVSGSFSGNITLNVGQNVITTVVTAQDGITTKTYTVTVKRPPSADANLAALVPGAGKLDPFFAQGVTAYSVTVPNTITEITLSPTVNEASASVKINGTTVSSGSPSNSFPLVVGANVITTTVTAQDGLTIKTYTVSVLRQKSTDATLSSIALTDGTLTPSFLSGTNTYTAAVPNSVTTISLKPVANESNATIAINGTAVKSGTSSGLIALVVGPNVITTVVTAQDGITTQTYSVTVTRKPSSDASLADLKLSSKTLSPAISSGSLLYNASVGNEVKTITFTPIVNQPDATVTINGVMVASGAASAAIPLKVGDNTITTVVTAQDGVTTKSYIATISRAPSTNANLAGLAVVPDQLNITFNKLITGYSMLLKNDVTSAVVTPTVEDATATVVINGIKVASGSASPAIPLKVGNTPITIVVTAEDGKTKKTYIIIANRALSSDNDLADLILSSGTLKPGFESGLNNYTASVAHTVGSVNVKPILADAAASVKVNGVTVASGSVSPEIKLNVGPNTINVVVAAQNTETNTYTIIVNRDPGTDANLINLGLSTGSLNPVFTVGNTNYAAMVLNTVTTIKITPTVEEATATVKVNGIAVASGSASQDIALTVGANTITTTVTAQDGTTAKTYTVTVTRVKSPDATLVSLVPGTSSLSPAFASSNTAYTLTTGNANNSITFVPTRSDDNASISVNGLAVASGTASQSIPLAVGSGNVVNILVTAEDGSTKNYTVTVTRQLSANADLSNLGLTAGLLKEGFTADNTAYTASVGNGVTTIGLIPTLSDATATIKVNNIAVASGSASGNFSLVVGENTINTVVTAANGTTKTYTVTITRAKSDNADLANIIVDNGKLTPGFTSGTNTYETPVGNAITQLKITPVVSEANATVTVNGATLTGGAANVPLIVGTNPISIVVTAQDGSTKTYTIVATREASSNATLSNIALNPGGSIPGFAANKLSYKVSVENSVTGLAVIPTAADLTATIKIRGEAVLSGSPSNNIPLTVGDNVIGIVVTAQDGITTQTYSLTITRAKSPNANLTNITLSSGASLSPLFSPSGVTYSATVSHDDQTIRITPTADDAAAVVRVNNLIVPNGSASGIIQLNVGITPVTITVTAEDGTNKTYTVNITRPRSPDATLADLSSATGTLTPAFSPTVLFYEIPVDNGVTSATLQPTANDAGASIQVNGVPVASGAVSQALTLKPGPNSYIVKVTAADGSVNTYVVTFVRGLSDDADLSSLVLTGGTLSPAFTTGNTSYEMRVSYNTPKTTVTAITTDADATLRVNGVIVKSGSASGSVTIGTASTLVTVTVTSASGKTKSYTVKVTRDAPPPSSDATLISLRTSVGDLAPAFSSGTKAYAVKVDASTQGITLTGITSDGGATIKINGAVVLSGSASDEITLAIGSTSMVVVVTAADGVTTQTYTVTVTKAALAAILPSVFTPNGDGANDYWVIPNIDLFPDCTVKIFNRGGQMVFSSVGYGTPWDGTLNGRVLPPDVYYYVIDLKHNQGVRSGAITIMR